MGQHHVPVALLRRWEGGVEGMQRIRGMGHRASLGAVVKRRLSPDVNRTAVVQFTDILLQSTDYTGCGRRHYIQMTVSQAKAVRSPFTCLRLTPYCHGTCCPRVHVPQWFML